MRQNKAPLFGVELRARGKIINLPVYEGDTDVSVLDRLYQTHPQSYDEGCRQIIKNKIIQSLQNMLNTAQTSTNLKYNISQFLKKCKIDVKIIIKEQEQNKKQKINQQQQKKKKTRNKDNQQFEKKKGQFTKLYQIMKSIFNNQQSALKQAKSKLYQNRSRIKNSKLNSNSLSKKLWNQFNKQNQLQILRRIQNKIKKYEKKYQNKINSEGQQINQTYSNQENMGNILQPNKASSIIYESNQNSQRGHKNNRFKYNYQQIISDRQNGQKSKREGNHSARKNIKVDKDQLSRCYDTFGSQLYFNYREQNINLSIPKYCYLSDSTNPNTHNNNGIRSKSVTYDTVLSQSNLNYNNRSSKINSKNSLILGQQKVLNSSFSQQKLKKFKYL